MVSVNPKKGMKRISLDIPEEDYFFFLDEVVSRKRKGQTVTMADLMREAFREYRKKLKKAK